VIIPTPEQLGVARRAEMHADWAVTRQRLQELGAVSFQVDHPAAGGCRFVCWLPQGQPGTTRCIEAHAATEAEAVRLALDRAARWRLEGR
jgi:hypothetical protein